MTSLDREFWTTHEPLATRMSVQYSLMVANERFAKAIGDRRYEDVEFKKGSRARKVVFLGN